MMILRDDPVIELFESPDAPPRWIEAIDIANNEYRFCDDLGQRYVGVVKQPTRWYRLPTYELQPLGTPDMAHALALLDRATMIERNQRFADLAGLRTYLLEHNQGA